MTTAAAVQAAPGVNDRDGGTAGQEQMQLQAPLPFVMLLDSGTFEIEKEAAQFLQQIRGSVAVVSIAGLYRTGKSYLLNLLLGRDRAEAMFNVGATVNACTKGIWIWGQPLASASQQLQDDELFRHLSKDTTIIFMDTEGLGSTDRSQTQDTRIFALALLLSSLFIYNSRGVIDSNAIEDLSLVVHLTKYIQTKAKSAATGNSDPSSNDGSELAAYFPDFLWVVRDFTLQLQEEGRAVSPRDYFESALKPQPPVNDEVVQKNKIRSLLATFFPNRDCVTMVRPLNDENLLRNLTAQPYESLRPEFREQMANLKRKIFTSLKPKRMMTNTLNGSMLVTLAKSYVDAFNSGTSPVISSVWDRVVESQCDVALARAKATFTKTFAARVAEHSGSVQVNNAMCRQPVEEDVAFTVYDIARQAAEAELDRDELRHSEAIHDYALQLSEFMVDHLQEYLIQNDAVSKTFNEALLKELHQTDKTDEFVDINGLPDTDGARFLHDKLSDARTAIERTVTAFQNRAKGPAQSLVLADFLVEKLTDGLLEWGALVKLVFRSKEADLATQVATAKQALRAIEGKVAAAQQVLSQQKESYERALQAIAERAADERATLRAESESKQSEIERAHLQMDKLAALHKEAVDRLDAQINEAKAERKQLEDAKREVEARRENERFASRRQLLESERHFHKEERDLMAQQQQALERVVELERQLGELDTDHMKEVFRLEKDGQAQLNELQIKNQDEQDVLKEQTIQEIRKLKEQQDDELRALQEQLNDSKAKFAALRERVEAKEAVAAVKRGKASTLSKEDCVVQ